MVHTCRKQDGRQRHFEKIEKLQYLSNGLTNKTQNFAK